MKSSKQGKIIFINALKKEESTPPAYQEKQKVVQVFSDLQEISQKIDQHLNQNIKPTRLKKDKHRVLSKFWQKPLFHLKENFSKILSLRQNLSLYSSKLSAIQKIVPSFRKRNKRY